MARSSTSYPRKWSSGKTTVIRVPEKFASKIVQIARKIDLAGECQVREDGDTLVLEMTPKRTISYTAGKPTNVSGIPQRSPFRYPGGKTWLVPHIRAWLSAQKRTPSRLIEPFAGGGIVSLTAGFEGLARHVIFSELDPGVAAVWKVILNGESEWLAKKIVQFRLDEERARRVLDAKAANLRDRAFQTILRNRVQRGGIMAPGAGLVKTGENGRGIGSRWYPQTLARRIREINQNRDRFTFVEGDAFALIEEHQKDAGACYYVDPPYTVAAKRLYPAWEVDHEKLFASLSRCRGDFLMSYDNTSDVVDLAKAHGFETAPIAMKSSHHARMTELLIGRNLSWVNS